MRLIILCVYTHFAAAAAEQQRQARSCSRVRDRRGAAIGASLARACMREVLMMVRVLNAFRNIRHRIRALTPINMKRNSGSGSGGGSGGGGGGGGGGSGGSGSGSGAGGSNVARTSTASTSHDLNPHPLTNARSSPLPPSATLHQQSADDVFNSPASPQPLAFTCTGICVRMHLCVCVLEITICVDADFCCQLYCFLLFGFFFCIFALERFFVPHTKEIA